MTNQPLDEERIFHTARLLPSDEAVAEYVDQICAGDQALRERVEALLKAHEEEQSFLKSDGEPAPTIDQLPFKAAPGQRIGRYKLLQKIGEGGFGVVYMAEQTKPVRRQVALKVIKPGMDTKEVIARFEAERQALAMMNHPNIARVFDGGETESGHPYFVMELVKGVPLTKFCDENTLDTNSRLNLFMDVCNAIQHAHQKGVIHRDIKPSNVLVTLHDGKAVPKVIDFGVSKAISQHLTAKTLFTTYGQMVGTPQYMSPEQAEMSGLDIDTRTDIYSLGVLLYELLTGTTPLDPARLRQTAYADLQRLIRDDDPPKPSRRLSTLGDQSVRIASDRRSEPRKLQATIQGEIDWIVMKSLDKDRNRRYDTPKEFRLDVERHLCNEPVHACPPSSSYRVRKMLRRNRSAVLVGSALIALLVAGLAGTSTGWIESLRAEKRETEQKDLATRALKAERNANRELKSLTESQTLVIAYEAFTSGNVEHARELLDRFVPNASSPLNLPWNFLKKRCEENEPQRLVFDGKIDCWELDPRGEFYAVGLASGELWIVDGSGTKTPVKQLNRNSTDGPNRWREVTFSSDGRRLLAACDSKLEGERGRVWSFNVLRDGRQYSISQSPVDVCHDREIWDVVCLGESNRAASIDRSGLLKIWDLDSGEVLDTRETEHLTQCGLSKTTDGKLIIAYDWAGRVQFHNTDGNGISVEIPYGERVHDVHVFADNRTALICGYLGPQIWSLGPAKPKRLNTLDWQRTFAGCISGDGQYLATTQTDAFTISLLETASNQVVARYTPPGSYESFEETRRIGIGRVRFQGDNIVCAVGNALNIFRIPVEATHWIQSSSYWYAPFAVSSSTPLAACPGESGTIKLWDIKSKKTVNLGKEDPSRITALSFSCDGKRLAVAESQRLDAVDEVGRTMRSGTIEVWGMNGELERTLPPQSGGIGSLEFSPVDPSLLASTGKQNEVRIWNVDRGTYEQLAAPTDDPNSGSVIAATFAGGGSQLMTGGSVWFNKDLSKGTTATLFDLSNRDDKPLPVPTTATYGCSTSHDGKSIAFTSYDHRQIDVIDLRKPGIPSRLE